MKLAGSGTETVDAFSSKCMQLQRGICGLIWTEITDHRTECSGMKRLGLGSRWGRGGTYGADLSAAGRYEKREHLPCPDGHGAVVRTDGPVFFVMHHPWARPLPRYCGKPEILMCARGS